MMAILGILLAIVIVIGLWVLRVSIAAAISWTIVSLFGFLSSLVGVDIYSAYDKGIIIAVVTVVLVIYSMINSKK